MQTEQKTEQFATMEDILAYFRASAEEFKQFKERIEFERKERETREAKEAAQREAERKQREAERKEREAERKEREIREAKEAAQREAERKEREIREAKEAAQREAERKQREAERKQREAERKQHEAERKQHEAEREAAFAKEHAENERSFKWLRRELGRLGNTFGDWAEDFFDKKILENFKALGFMFDRNSRKTKFRHPGETDTFAEVDFWLENGEYVMAVEVKSDFKSQYMERTLERLGQIGDHLRLKGDNRKLIGAVAGMTFDESVQQNALKNGLFVITQSGENAVVVPPQATPKIW